MDCESDLYTCSEFLVREMIFQLRKQPKVTRTYIRGVGRMIKCFHPYILKVCGDLFRFMTTGIIMQKFNPTRASSRSRLFVVFFNFYEDLRTIKASSHILALR